MDKPIYGITYKGVHTDTSKTLRGAKLYATQNGYNFVSVRYGYNASIIAIKQNNKWIDYK